MVVDKTGERGLRRRFTLKHLPQSRRRPEQVFTPPFTKSAAFCIRSGKALGVAGGAQAHQLPLFVRDKAG
jgi:hypothetical protein